MFYRIRRFFSRRAFKVKRVDTNLPVTLLAASIVIAPVATDVPRVCLTGRDYNVYAFDKYGNPQKLKRVKSFTFHADANEPAKFTVEYYDHDKASL